MSNPPSPTRPRPRPSARRQQAAPAHDQAAATYEFEAVGGSGAPMAGPPESASGAADRLPVNEFLFNRAGAPSPFGDDLQFPLPAGALSYRHRA